MVFNKLTLIFGGVLGLFIVVMMIFIVGGLLKTVAVDIDGENGYAANGTGRMLEMADNATEQFPNVGKLLGIVAIILTLGLIVGGGIYAHKQGYF